jgi:hypothetical protein
VQVESWPCNWFLCSFAPRPLRSSTPRLLHSLAPPLLFLLYPASHLTRLFLTLLSFYNNIYSKFKQQIKAHTNGAQIKRGKPLNYSQQPAGATSLFNNVAPLQQAVYVHCAGCDDRYIYRPGDARASNSPLQDGISHGAGCILKNGILFFEMIYYFWTNRRVRTHSFQIFDKRRAHLYYFESMRAMKEMPSRNEHKKKSPAGQWTLESAAAARARGVACGHDLLKLNLIWSFSKVNYEWWSM